MTDFAQLSGGKLFWHANFFSTGPGERKHEMAVPKGDLLS
jgi:hypothetical protein